MPNYTRQLITLPNISVNGVIDLGEFELVSSQDLAKFPRSYHRHVKSFANMYHTVNHPVSDVGVLVRKSGASRLGVLTEGETQTIGKVLDGY